MKDLKKYTFAVLFFVSAISMYGQKFGYVDTQALLIDMPDVKEANSNIETFTTQLQKKGQDMIKALQAKAQELERKQAQGAISPLELETEAQKLKNEETTIMKFEQESQQKIMKKREDLLLPLRNRIQSAISEVADENNFDYIFDLSTGFVLYADKTTDVGALVKTKLGL
ncbi:OmpH family outer membrane protein [Saprospiraceae bacterium]|nr:OmpH family outer membrane protein [Saprospiraceae bacterium]